MRAKIYFDANFSVGQYRGMGKYMNFLQESLISEGYEVVPLLTAGLKVKGGMNMGFKNYILWEQLSLPTFQRDNKGIYIYPYNTAPIKRITDGNEHVVVIHDLIFMKDLGETKSLRQKIGKIYRKFVVPRIVNKYDHIITVSEYSKNEIINYFNVPENKITVIPNAIDTKDGITSEKKEDYIFHLGGEPDYKNTIVLVKAFALLPAALQKRFRLKILGIRDKKVIGIYKELFKKLKISEQVDLLGYQEDKEVECLFKKASLFVFTSFEEGFGIPLIEAMRYGTPILCSSASCLPEIAGEAAVYFNPLAEEELSVKLAELLLNPDLMDERVNLGSMRVEKFSKTNVKKKLVAYFNKINESFNYSS